MLRASLLIIVLALPSLVRADIAPDPNYVEKCTAALKQTAGYQCVDCRTYYANAADYCAKETGTGYAMICRASGASAWTEVWCRSVGVDASSAAPQPPRTDGGAADVARVDSGTAVPAPQPLDAAAPVSSTDAGTGDAGAPAGGKKDDGGCSLAERGKLPSQLAALALAGAVALLIRKRRLR